MRAALALLSLLALLLCGCRDQGDGGEELAFLRRPGVEEDLKVATQDLFPARVGTRWKMRVILPSGSVREEERVVAESSPTPSGTRCVIQTIFGGKPVAREVYLIGKDGVYQQSASTNQTVTINPPQPFLPLPIVEEKVHEWQGTMSLGKVMGGAHSWTRITGKMKIKVPAGEFDCWRVDSMSDATIQGKRATTLTMRWFAPGIGMIKLRNYLGNKVILKELAALPSGAPRKPAR